MLIKAIIKDIDIQQCLKNMCNFMNDSIRSHGSFSKSPDGIQNACLMGYKEWKSFVVMVIKDTLADKRFVHRSIRYIPGIYLDSCFSAVIQRFLKLLQVTNIVLPSVIVNERGSIETTSATTTTHKLLSPSSFYVQAKIRPDHVDFTLNKIIETSLSSGTVQTFTVQEKSIKIQNMISSACDNLWNHLEEHQKHFRKYCENHDEIIFSSRIYDSFSRSFKKLVNTWVSRAVTFSNLLA